MSLDVTKKIKSITYNGTEIPLDDAGSNALLNELRTQLLAVQGELQAKESELEAKEAELTAKEAELTAQQAIEDSIIERSCISYYNNRVSNVRQYMFLAATSLESVHLPNVTGGLEYGAFQGCSNLQVAIFEKLTYIRNSFANCSALKVLVLGNSGWICTLGDVSFLANTPIANGAGFVYVRDNQVDSFKTATNWSTYAAQIKPISELQTTHPEIYAKLEL